MSLRNSYTLLAPVYDWLIGPALARVRAQSLARLPSATGGWQEYTALSLRFAGS